MLVTGPDMRGGGDAAVVAGRYRLGELLGQGGMADVHRAVDERTGTPVAVKVVRSPDPATARRLAQEAQALERLRHPGLVRLLDTGVADGRAYLVMELVEGPTLGRLLHDGPMAPARVADVAGSVAGALAYVHAQGIVHRDVKPGNILVGADGHARLADFGIASLADASMLTVTGTTLGTAAYMAPEQIQHHQVGPAADVWSLAMVLLECLLGRRVYEGSPAQVVARRLAGPVPVPGDLPEPWQSLLTTMFAQEPDRRPPAGAVAAAVASDGYRLPWTPSERAPLAETAPLAGATPATRTTPLARSGTSAAGAAAAAGATATIAFTPGPQTAPTALGALRPAAVPLWRQRRWLAVGATAVGAVAVIVLVAALLGSGTPARSAVGTSRRHTPAPTTVPTTTTPTTTTTTAPPSPGQASGALLAALGQDVTAGALSADRATTIGKDVSAALIDVTTGNTAAAAKQLDAAASTVASTGSLPAADATVLQADLATLATALGLSAPVASSSPAPATTTPTGPAGGPGAGAGPGAGGPGKGQKGGKGH